MAGKKLDPHDPLRAMVGEYANAVGRHGPDSEQARWVREKYWGDAEFGLYADTLDRIMRALGGSGIDYPAGSVSSRPWPG